MANSVLVLDTFKGLGTFFWVELFLHGDEKRDDLQAVQASLEETITSFDNTYSRFKETSLLSELNREGIIPYDEHLAEMVKHARKASYITDNIFSIFIKEALEEKGYGEHLLQKTVVKKGEKSDVVINEKTVTLLGDKGIDLGGVGKGYLIDLLSRILKEKYNLHYFVINGGGDIFVTSNHGLPIELYLEHPINQGEYIGTINVKDKAFCSSSSFKRRWKKDGKEVNHFIADKEVWAASYVLSDTATIADMYATVFCIESNNKQELDRLAQTTEVDYTVITKEGEMIQSEGFKKITNDA